MNVCTRLAGIALAAAVQLAAAPTRADGPGGLTPETLASDGMLYSVDHATGNLFTIDPNTAAISVVGPVGFNFIEGLTYHSPTDTFLGIDNDSDQLISINRYTGAGTAVGPIGRDHVFGLTYSEHNDTLYGVDTQTSDLLRLDPTTGAADEMGPTFFDFVGGLTDNPDTGTLYGVDYGSDEVFVIGFDEGLVLSGGIVDVSGSAMQGVAYDSTTNDLFAISIEVGPEELLRIDPLSDAVTVVGTLGGVAPASLAFVPNGVPEPSAFASLVIGMLATVAGRGRAWGAHPRCLVTPRGGRAR